MSDSYTQLLYHFVWSTKGRRKLLSDKIHSRLSQYFKGLLGKKRCTLLSSGIQPDHVHLLVQCHPDTAVSELMRYLKANTSKWLRQSDLVTDQFSWQRGYSAFSVSVSSAESVNAYVDNQEDHHAVRSFDEELRLLLEKHGIEADYLD